MPRWTEARVFSDDIGMVFGTDKHGRIILNRGPELPNGAIKYVEEGNHQS